MASIAEIQRKINQKESQVKKYRDRQKKVKEAGDQISSKLPGRITDVNSKITSCANNLEDAVKIDGRVLQAVDQVLDRREEGIGSDSDIREMSQKIEEERRRCGRKIEALNAEIASLKRELARLREEEE